MPFQIDWDLGVVTLLVCVVQKKERIKNRAGRMEKVMQRLETGKNKYILSGVDEGQVWLDERMNSRCAG